MDLAATLGVAGIVSAVVSALFRVVGDSWLIGVKLNHEYKYEEQKALRKAMGRFHGRMLGAALDWDRRMQQLYFETDEGGSRRNSFHWLNIEGPEKDLRCDQHYMFHSVVFRFLSLLAIARLFEKQSFYIEAEFAKKDELKFLRYTKGFLWVMTHPELTPEDGVPGVDHFRNDDFRPLLDLCYGGIDGARQTEANGEQIFDMRYYREMLAWDPKGSEKRLIDELLLYFHRLSPGEVGHKGRRRLRWERLVCLHLLTLGFIADFGYEWQRRECGLPEKIDTAVKSLVKHNEVTAKALLRDIPSLGLTDRSATKRRPRSGLGRRSKDSGLERVCNELENALQAKGREHW